MEVLLKGGPETLEALSSRLIELGSPGVLRAGDRRTGSRGDAVPGDTAPGDTVPRDTVPGDAAPEDEVRGYLPEDAALGGALDEIRRYVGSLRRLGFLVGDVGVRRAPRVDWVRDFQERCVPRRVGRFRIVPETPRDRPPRVSRGGEGRKGGRTEIVMTPAMAFGTGEHPTTRLCLKALGECVGRLRPRRVLDIGSGSGILGIAAARAFRTCRVTAVDIDPAACFATRENARKNRVAGRVTAREGSIERVRGKFDLILANLYLEPLRNMTPEIGRRLAEKGRALLSGLLVPQAAEIRSALRAAGLEVEKRRSEAGWSCLTVFRKES